MIRSKDTPYAQGGITMLNIIRKSGLGAPVAFLGAVTAAIGANQGWALVVYIGALAAAAGALLAADEQRRAYKKLAARSEKIIDSVLGGNSFCYMNIVDPVRTEGLGNAVFVHVGEHPLYDVQALIIDVEAWLAVGRVVILGKTHFNVTIGNMIPGYCIFEHMLLKLGDGDTRSFNIIFVARNGGFVQDIRFKMKDGDWACATRVRRNGEVIHQAIHDEFPRNAEGSVDWE